jgi:hypothetical protein
MKSRLSTPAPPNEEELTVFGRATTPAFPIAGTMDQVRPQGGQWHCDHVYLDWPAYPHSDTQQVAAMRRPRTEARACDWITQEGLTNRGPL